MSSKTRMSILTNSPLLAILIGADFFGWAIVTANANADAAAVQPTAHASTHSAPSTTQRTAPILLPVPTPSSGSPPAEVWLPRTLSSDDKNKRAASDLALMREERLNSNAMINLRRLQAELMNKQYDLIATQLDGILTRSIADPNYEFVELGATDFAQGANYLGVPSLPDQFLDEWEHSRPDSPWAHYSQGAVLLQEAWAVRGEHYADTVSDKHWQMMHRFLLKARKEFEEALKLDPNILMAQGGLIQIDLLGGTQADAKRDYRAGMKQRPLSLRLPSQYEEVLKPRWGGAYASMNALAKDRATETDRNPRLWSLLGSALAEKGYTEVDESCSPCSRAHWEASLKYYNAALAYEDKPVWLQKAGEAAVNLHRYALAYRYYERAHEYDPATFSWYATMQLMQTLCAPNFDSDKFEVTKLSLANYVQLPTMNFPRMHGDCTYYQAELPWGTELQPDAGSLLPYEINVRMPAQQAPKK